MLVPARAQTAAPTPASGPAKDAAEWHKARVERLTGPNGWLTLVALHWLAPGETRFGAAKGNGLVLAAPGIPDDAGSFVLENGRVRLVPRTDTLTIDGRPATARTLGADVDETPDVMQLGRLTMVVVKRADRVGVRVKDPEAKTRREFKGIGTFPYDPAYRVTGRFVKFPAPKTILIPTAIGTTEKAEISGEVRFTLGGREVTLTPTGEAPDGLSFVFNDETSGIETYGAGRFLEADAPKDGRVVLDFNLAYNPPCAFTEFATCPLPPRENRLKVRIAAGEKAYGENH